VWERLEGAQPRDVVHPGVEPCRVGTLLEGRDALRHVVVQHHHGCELALDQDLDFAQHGDVSWLQAGVLLPVDMGGRWCGSRQRQPLVGIYLHQHLVLPPALPPVGAEGGEVLQRTLHPVLEVVATEVRGWPIHSAQHVEPPKHAHRWPHPHEHLIEVDKDRHQCDGVW
jgi:hypothetical protein